MKNRRIDDEGYEIQRLYASNMIFSKAAVSDLNNPNVVIIEIIVSFYNQVM